MRIKSHLLSVLSTITALVIALSVPRSMYASFNPITILQQQDDQLPSRVDYSADMPEVKDQSNQNSCVAFAVGYYYMSYLQHREHGWGYTRQTLFSSSYIYNQVATANNSTLHFTEAFELLQTQGIAPESVFPSYTGNVDRKPNEEEKREAEKYKILSYSRIPGNGGDNFLVELRRHLAQDGPVVIGIPLQVGWWISLWRDIPTVIEKRSANDSKYNHAVLLVGYDDATRRFKFINSYGKGWGEDGYGYITYEFITTTTTDVEAYTMIVAPQPQYLLLAIPKYPVAKPGEPVTITIELQNNGTRDWAGDGSIALIRENGDSLGLPSPMGINQQIVAGSSGVFRLHVTAPMQSGIYSSVWRMAFRGRPFGEPIPISVIVAPETENKDLRTTLQALADQEWQRINQMFVDAQHRITSAIYTAIEDVKRRVAEYIMQEISHEIWRLTKGLCGTPPASAVIVTGYAWWRRRKKVGKRSIGGG